MGLSIFWTFVVILVSYISFRLFKRILNKIAKTKSVDMKRLFYIQKVFEILFVIIAMVAMSFVWSVDFKGVSVFASSIFAIIGVAMFAQWSILSNVTASIIIFFTFPARVGDKIKIVDGDNSVEGTIREISLFQIELIDSEKNLVLYPNNLLLQKPVIRINK
ncbi:mechanosensitive ion channel family protein [Candidatus Sulfurimonas baltica]|uniref:Mechanosensitive ion channel family protein n=1 Tax=Candidatus Sulfurimonas baltica TaxID=2740404 RepID=A0A7S7LUQ1_9BACT|nr:mechanosensitive ion channel family protein [Candidatus Sulfurimonas baltica]QOY51811.1 mechanosensitive ion channel family protein [Candidatus Sulfurimonas baltica]